MNKFANIVKNILFEEDLNNVLQFKSLDSREVQRAIRDAIIAEQDAIKQYEVIVDSTNDDRIKKVLQDISNEEKVHIGELQRLLELFDKEDKELQTDGRHETMDNL